MNQCVKRVLKFLNPEYIYIYIYIHFIGASNDLATVTMTLVPNTFLVKIELPIDNDKVQKKENYPKNVVDKQSAQKNAAVQDLIELQEFDTVYGERQAENVVGDPMLKMRNYIEITNE